MSILSDTSRESKGAYTFICMPLKYRSVVSVKLIYF